MHRPPRLLFALGVAVVVAAAIIVVSATLFRGRSGASPGPTSAVVASPTPEATASASSPAAAASRSSTPTGVGHVYVLVMENKESSTVLGNADAPYLNQLAHANAVATNYTGVAHPSEPNYLALFSGSTHGVSDDGMHTITGAKTLADQVAAAGRSWHVAAENVPDGCFTGGSASGGPDGAGTYARKHEPAISFAQIADDPAQCARITDFTHFDPDLGDLWLIVPNMCHDMHDCSVAEGDAFLARFVPTILDSASFKRDGVLFITFDEGTSGAGGGGKVATLVIGPRAASGTTSDRSYDHYSLLRTIEDAWGLSCLEHACDAHPMNDLLRS